MVFLQKIGIHFSTLIPEYAITIPGLSKTGCPKPGRGFLSEKKIEKNLENFPRRRYILVEGKRAPSRQGFSTCLILLTFGRNFHINNRVFTWGGNAQTREE